MEVEEVEVTLEEVEVTLEEAEVTLEEVVVISEGGSKDVDGTTEGDLVEGAMVEEEDIDIGRQLCVQDKYT
jgi:hypothetical protein